MPRPPKISQSQLADELGVSQALVSLVLNGRRQGINTETYQRIWDHAMLRGYHPKGMHVQSSPAVSQPRNVAVILRAPLRFNSLGNYFGLIQNGLHAALDAQVLSTSFLGAEDELDDTKLARYFAPGHTYKGVVLFGQVAPAFLRRLRRFEPRIVAVSARFTGQTHSVLGNERQAMEQLVAHLHELGHRRIGWLGGNCNLERHHTRLVYLREALALHDLQLDPRYQVALTQADRAEGTEAVHAIETHVGRADFPTAFVCYNSLMAHGAIRAFVRAGLNVPADVSVAAGDPPRRDMVELPGITGAGSAPEDLGATAARLILESRGEPNELLNDVILPSQLTIGGSTGPVRADRAANTTG